MKTYNITEVQEHADGSCETIHESKMNATSAAEAVRKYCPSFLDTDQVTSDPRYDLAELRGPKNGKGDRIIIEAEPEPGTTQYGALREAIARALVAEQLCEAAVAELARVAGLPVDTAYTCMLSLPEWIPGDPITDEQCQAFMETEASTK